MKQVTIPAQWLQELIALCGPEDHELRERVMKSAAPAPADALATATGTSAQVIKPSGLLTVDEYQAKYLHIHKMSDDERYGYECLYNEIVSGLQIPNAASQAQADARDAEITWPKARDVGRIGDMSPDAHMRVGFDSDNDVFVSVWDENGGGSIEFCNPGGGGGGQSSRTRMALIALMVAMEADNAEKPSRDWWGQRAAIAAAKGE